MPVIVYPCPLHPFEPSTPDSDSPRSLVNRVLSHIGWSGILNHPPALTLPAHSMSKLLARRLVALLVAVACGVVLLTVAPTPAPVKAAEPADEFVTSVRPLIAKYCAECHNDKKPEADLDLTTFITLADVKKSPKVWQKVGEMIDGGQMPPKDATQKPTAEEKQKLQAWVRAHLKNEAKAHAGDPGKVTLRRLSNAEYTYTLRDLSGVPTLDPAKEFPVDGAAGEGFTNSGEALVMSPALLEKYLAAGKGVGAHMVLLPDGIRFSPSTTRRDHTNELLDRIRGLYARYTDGSTGSQLNLQGVVFNNADGGRLPIEKYLLALLNERKANLAVTQSPEQIAANRGLSPKYMAAVWAMLNGQESSPLLDDLRARWKTAKPGDVPALMAYIAGWQSAVWKFSPIGHIGKIGGPKAWMEPVDPLAASTELRWKVPPTPTGEVAFYLVAADAGGGDSALFSRPRFVAPGRPELLLKDVQALAAERTARRTEAFAVTAKYLTAVDEAVTAKGTADVPALAKKHQLNADVLAGWLTALGVGSSGSVKVTGHLDNKLTKGGGYEFISGWGSNDTPLVLANSSDKLVRIPGDARGNGVVMHPSPTLNVAAGWQAPVGGEAKITAKVQHAHVACGNGVAWAVEVRRGGTRERLASGTAQGAKPADSSSDKVSITKGDLVSVVVGPRDANHSCDLTAVDFTITIDGKTWDLGKDVTGEITAGNPHADGQGNAGVWHFYTEPVAGAVAEVLPKDSPLGKWRAANGDERAKLAGDVQTWLSGASKDPLHAKLSALNGPLFGRIPPGKSVDAKWGVDATLFANTDHLKVKAGTVTGVKVPADLVAGAEFVAGGSLPADSKGAVQLRVSGTKSAATLQPGSPILVNNSPARERFTASLTAFRDLFPPAVCYSKIVPVDEVVTLTLHHREDGHMSRLLLTDAEAKQLDRLWDELHYVSQDAFAQVDAFKQLLEFASQDGDPKLFEPLMKPTMDAAEAFKKRLTDTEPAHLKGLLEFAGRAYRRPLKKTEADELTALYAKLRKQELPHDESIRLTLARVLVSPSFLYKLEKPGPDATAAAVNDFELATRLSYFLWSSCPDDELHAAAAAGKLRDPDVLTAQMKRMLKDAKVRRLGDEFGCQWLHVRDFATLNEKSERHFPEFASLRGDMHTEAELFFTDLFTADRPVRDLLDSNATYLNESLAKFYGVPGVNGTAWRRVEGMKKHGRGGILGLSATLAMQSGASRTSPILRGNWVSEVLLGEKLPRPPKGVPQLPDDEAATDKLTVRQLVEKHTSDARCAVCHQRIDAYGFSLEGFDPIGRKRDKDLGGRPIDVNAKAMDGTAFTGIDGLRDYLLTKRKDAFERQFLKKLLGYALGRAVQLSDELLLDDMQAVAAKGGTMSAVVAKVVTSKQFRDIRGAKQSD